MKIRSASLLLILTTSVLRLFAQIESADEKSIRSIIDQFSPMWTTSEGPAIFDKITSDDDFMLILEQAVFKKDEFHKVIAKVVSNNPPVEYNHKVRRIVIVENVAFEYGTTESVWKDGSVTMNEGMNIFSREQSGWKYVFGVPAKDLKKIFEPDVEKQVDLVMGKKYACVISITEGPGSPLTVIQRISFEDGGKAFLYKDGNMMMGDYLIEGNKVNLRVSGIVERKKLKHTLEMDGIMDGGYITGTFIDRFESGAEQSGDFRMEK
ncbi:MAG: hypothetical protein A2Z99_14325 [Treponema sp. GWB1_62_6]|nr:MAG: hypothetical protein A2Z99_14325 [Treponema sp. GWB1_62_6]OHE68203.1 MAG: hypothetical protein A2001_17995 [Treponema sp. GWC1_61_84]OHE69026.1 MAG: hypothetical protein A2413_04510 [Treponema sp. RIFOXYC1_FULL_61_9]HCM25606.1 hypothetical protein [Treponema sp.]